MNAYRISAAALLRLAFLADGAAKADPSEIVTILRDVEPIDAAPAEELDPAAAKIAKPE